MNVLSRKKRCKAYSKLLTEDRCNISLESYFFQDKCLLIKDCFRLFQLDSKDQALDELEMRQSQISSLEMRQSQISAPIVKESSTAETDTSELSQAEREAFENLKEQVSSFIQLLSGTNKMFSIYKAIVFSNFRQKQIL